MCAQHLACIFSDRIFCTVTDVDIFVQALYRSDRFYSLSGLVRITSESLSVISRAFGGGDIKVLMDDWLLNLDKRERARMRALERVEVSRERAAQIGVLARDGTGDGLGVAIAGGTSRVLALASQYCVSPAEVVGAARSAAGALGAAANDIIATALSQRRLRFSPPMASQTAWDARSPVGSWCS